MPQLLLAKQPAAAGQLLHRLGIAGFAQRDDFQRSRLAGVGVAQLAGLAVAETRPRARVLIIAPGGDKLWVPAAPNK